MESVHVAASEMGYLALLLLILALPSLAIGTYRTVRDDRWAWLNPTTHFSPGD